MCVYQCHALPQGFQLDTNFMQIYNTSNTDRDSIILDATLLVAQQEGHPICNRTES